MLMATFGEKLKQLRTGAKLSQTQLAKRIKLGYKTIYLYESGKAAPSIDIAARIAKFFQVSTDYLIFDDQEQEEKVRDRELLEYLVKADRLHHVHKTMIKEIIDGLLATESQEAPKQRAS
jgi:transcriptional regulator with XRE-family HTH domain